MAGSAAGKVRRSVSPLLIARARVTSLIAVLSAFALIGNAAPAMAMPATTTSFLGMGTTTSPAVVTGTPPDPNGAVGPNHYVQVVNGGIAIWSKSGTVVQAAKLVNTLWAGYAGFNAGNGCATRNDGDPIVRYDTLADRWLVMQFSLPNSSITGGPSFECVAVSKTGDPTGAYWLYDFRYAFAINDYAKVGVWPDAYYATFDMFANNVTFSGPQACAWDRAAMLAGQPQTAATQQCFPVGTSYSSLLAANLDGHRPPPSGSPEYFLSLDTNALQVWKFHVDWTNPPLSTFTGPTTLPTAAFTVPCPTTISCVPEPSPGDKVEALGDRLMDRLAYRNFGDHESLVVNHTVVSAPTAGVRWYELRVTAQTPFIFQQGTYAPADGNWRWMGSIAQDQSGNIALGFSESSLSLKPSIAWTGRVPSDGAGTMGQGESVLVTGLGVTTGGAHRWGDYSSMTVDPADDCTFWYTNEVYATNGFQTWQTQIASFKFPTCAPDTTPPETTVTKHPRKRTHKRRPTFIFSSPDAARFECQIDRRPYVECTSPFKTRRLSYRRHTFRVRAIDWSGNTDPSPAKWVFKVVK